MLLGLGAPSQMSCTQSTKIAWKVYCCHLWIILWCCIS